VYGRSDLDKLSRVGDPVLGEVQPYTESGAHLRAQAGEAIRDGPGRTTVAENDGALT